MSGVGSSEGRYVALREFDAAEGRGVLEGRVLRRYGRGERESCRVGSGDEDRVGVGGVRIVGTSMM